MNSNRKQNSIDRLVNYFNKFKLLRPLVGIFFKHREIIMYLVFGVLTTLVDFAVYFPLHNLLQVHYLLSNLFAWIAAVVFAFITNKLWVFDSPSFKINVVAREFTAFVGGRLLSFAIQEILLYAFVDMADLNSNISKIVVSVVVIILNYIFSKLFVFAKNKSKSEK